MRRMVIVIIFMLTLFFVVGCTDKKMPKTVEGIEVLESSIPKEAVYLDDFLLSDILIRVNYSDDTHEVISLSSVMISSQALVSLSVPGEKNIEVSYKNKTAHFLIHLMERETVDYDHVNVIAMNDTHGAFNMDGAYPGIEQVSQVIKERANNNGPSIKIANGDIFQGAFVSNTHFGKPMIDALNAMDFDAFVLGNHEFDWGLEKIALYKDGNLENGEANFEFLAANIVYKNTQKKLDWTKDYVIVENNGYRVGIIGVIQDGLESSIATDKVEDFYFQEPVAIVQKIAKQLRVEDKVDLVIVSIHGYSELINARLAALTADSRIDGIIAGHTHQQISEYITRVDDYEVPVIQSQTKNGSIGELVFSFEDNKVKEAQMTHYYPQDYNADYNLASVIALYQKTIDEGERIVAYTPEYLSRDTLGRELTKAMQDKYHADVAIINTGGVRDTISQGNIAVKKVYDVFPFDNYVVRTTMSGSRLKSLYSEQGAYLYFNPGFFAPSLNDYTIYEVVTIDYVFTNAYYDYHFSQSLGTYQDVTMRDVFIEYLEDWN